MTAQSARSLWLAGIWLALLASGGCGKSSHQTSDSNKGTIIEPKIAGQEPPPSVLFNIQRAKEVVHPNVELYDCSYQSRGTTAKFRLELQQKDALTGDGFPVARAQGRFIAVPGSDNSELLEDLTKALEAKRVPSEVPRQIELAFDAAVLGERQSRNSGGGYSDNPPGDWILIKIFLPKGEDEGEVFLNLNPVLGKAEFSIKDSDYGDYVVQQLAKVL
jgi:hypothetical protein